jgi:hypothetical protein
MVGTLPIWMASRARCELCRYFQARQRVGTIDMLAGVVRHGCTLIAILKTAWGKGPRAQPFQARYASIHPTYRPVFLDHHKFGKTWKNLLELIVNGGWRVIISLFLECGASQATPT